MKIIKIITKVINFPPTKDKTCQMDCLYKVVAYTNACILCSQILSLERWNIWHFHHLHIDILEIFILWFSRLFNYKTEHRLGYLSWEGRYTKKNSNLGEGSLTWGLGYSPMLSYTLQIELHHVINTISYP